MKAKEEQLLLAVDKGQTGKIETLISQGVNVNYRSQKDGATPLIRAAIKRNHVVLKILLSHGARVGDKDECGLSAIHYISASGDTENLKLLIAYQSSIEIKDEMGCTPLHYAADRNNFTVADILIFCGADASTRNKSGLSPFAVNNEQNFRNLVKESERVLDGIKNKDVYIQHDELKPGKESHLEEIGLTITTPKNFPMTSLSFLCRRVRPEFCKEVLRPKGKEILISDAFEYITSTTHLRGIVNLKVPLYDKPEPYEVMFIKSEQGLWKIEMEEEGGTSHIYHETISGKLFWFCDVQIDITKGRSVILVTVPKVEKFVVDDQGGMFESKVDSFINIEVKPQTFNSGTVNLEVVPTPVFKQEQFAEIKSIGHFYDLKHSRGQNKFQENGVTFTTPLPHDYDGDGELCILAADIPDDYDPDDDTSVDNFQHMWEIIQREPKAKRGRVSCDLSHFSVYVNVEKIKSSSDAELKSKTAKLYGKAVKGARMINFFAVIRPLDGNIFDTIIECTTPQRVEDRLNEWKTQNYILQTPNHTGDFETCEKMEFSIKLSENLHKCFGSPKTFLQFHSKKETIFQQIQIKLKDAEGPGLGSIDIYKTENGVEDEDGVTNILVQFSGNVMKRPVKEPKEKDSFKGFTKNSLLKAIANKLGPEWIQFCLLLGIPFQKVDKIRTKSSSKKGTSEDKAYKLLKEWRKNSMNMTNLGVIELATALSRVDRKDIAEFVHEELRNWVRERGEENEDVFMKWAKSTLRGSSGLKENEGVPEPMSDEFFVLFIQKYSTQEFQSLGIYMGIPENQNSNIFTETTFPNFQYRVLRMLMAARERHGDKMEAFKSLLDALQMAGLYTAEEWIRESTKEWLNGNTEKKTKFRLDLENFMKKENDEDVQTDIADENDTLHKKDTTSLTSNDKQEEMVTNVQFGSSQSESRINSNNGSKTDLKKKKSHAKTPEDIDNTTLAPDNDDKHLEESKYHISKSLEQNSEREKEGADVSGYNNNKMEQMDGLGNEKDNALSVQSNKDIGNENQLIHDHKDTPDLKQINEKEESSQQNFESGDVQNTKSVEKEMNNTKLDDENQTEKENHNV